MMMTRRNFLQQAGTVAVSINLPFSPSVINKSNEDMIMTVTGPIDAKNLGFCLSHEHILSRFGAPAAEPPSYDYHQAEQELVPYLKYMKEMGVDSIADCTAAYFGRDAKLLQILSQQSGIIILTNTGIYGAASDRYIPQKAYTMNPEELAAEWVEEFEHGIGDSGVKPGFVKIGVDGNGLSEIDAKLVRAGALTHLQTGLTLAIHTSGNVEGAMHELKILKEEGVSPQSWIWVHAQNVNDDKPLLEAAEQGAWISLDGVRIEYYALGQKQGRNTLEHHLQKLKMLKEHGYLNQVLISHDGSSFPPEGKAKRPFDVISHTFIPILRIAGFSDNELAQIFKVNPRNALKIGIRKV